MSNLSEYQYNVGEEGRPVISVVVISYNEEVDLPGFLDNLLPWVGEVVIVDDGSTDRTKEIALSRGKKVRFVDSPRQTGEYFSHQRNKGIEASTGDWLLHMDVDERVPPALAKEILGAIQDQHKDAYKFRRLNFFLHRPMKGGGWQNWNQVHLARREVFRFAGMYHEECIVDAPSERIGQLKEMMWHLNDDSYKERMQKSFLYCQEQAIRLVDSGIRIKWWHLLLLPGTEFLRKILKNHGYRDGTLGLLFALHSADAMFRACALVWDQQNSLDRSVLEERLKKMWNDQNG